MTYKSPTSLKGSLSSFLALERGFPSSTALGAGATPRHRPQGSPPVLQLLSSLAPKDVSGDYATTPAFPPSLSRSLLLCLSLTESRNLLLELQTH